MHEIMREIERIIKERDQQRKAANFMAKWVDVKYRDGAAITSREYQEFLAELDQVTRG